MTELHVDLGTIQNIKVSDNLDVEVEGSELRIQSLIDSEIIDSNFNEVEDRLDVTNSRLSSLETRFEHLLSHLRNVN